MPFSDWLRYSLSIPWQIVSGETVCACWQNGGRFLAFSKCLWIRDGPLEKWWGEGNFQVAGIFFFCSLLVHEFFFSWNTLLEFFFSNKWCFFLSEILIHYLFLWFVNYSTLTTDQRMQAIFFIVWKIFSKIYWEQEVTLSWPLPCAFL